MLSRGAELLSVNVRWNCWCLPSSTLSFVTTVLILAKTSRFRRTGLPPGPAVFPIIGNLHWLQASISQTEPLLRGLKRLYGPIVTLHIGSHPVIFIYDRELVHEALIHNGVALAGRPALTEASRVISANGYNISNATYGPLRRLLRRNLTSGILHPCRVQLFSKGREWVLRVLTDKLREQAARQEGFVIAMEAFQYGIFCLFVLLCFGEWPGEESIREIERIQKETLVQFQKIQIFAFFPGIARHVFPKGGWKWLSCADDSATSTSPHPSPT